jgi:excisionase family DNA binding protein
MTVRLALTIPEAAKACGVDDSRIRRAIHAGELKAKRSGRARNGIDGAGKLLIRPADLDVWLDGLADA